MILTDYIYALLVGERKCATWRMQRILTSQGVLFTTAQIRKECKRMENAGMIRRDLRYCAGNNLVWELAK